ncbi:MAG: hypothetical protein F6K53_39750 [Moorea sp. SIO4A1]|uniref:hypothetical protein n=1 Tax=Moorena sp. SIO4A1 TaxID=2607835 RepID=UPI0014503EAC|nr:hypothetical protein [Moorena sp. SIO4A1]NEQ63160.1 hypothetical protein [Moorena sp. SIO4A1]
MTSKLAIALIAISVFDLSAKGVISNPGVYLLLRQSMVSFMPKRLTLKPHLSCDALEQR